MSVAVAAEWAWEPRHPPVPRLTGVRSAASLGVARYCDRLAEALAALDVDYRLAEAPLGGRATHFHLANSSRRTIAQALRCDSYVVTLHDVQPRTRALEPFYRTLVYPRVIDRSAATVVHSAFAADLLRSLGATPRRLELIRILPRSRTASTAARHGPC